MVCEHWAANKFLLAEWKFGYDASVLDLWYDVVIGLTHMIHQWHISGLPYIGLPAICH